ncbi:hypothetical protein ACFYZE_26795 [Streptomyces sp. NPDC001796]|uniref:hypothetical protein n=1 Tax=Streptomyces sp. NPDC001796 TaxID=3364609 RepID=UPI0036CE4C8E
MTPRRPSTAPDESATPSRQATRSGASVPQPRPSSAPGVPPAGANGTSAPGGDRLRPTQLNGSAGTIPPRPEQPPAAAPPSGPQAPAVPRRTPPARTTFPPVPPRPEQPPRNQTATGSGAAGALVRPGTDEFFGRSGAQAGSRRPDVADAPGHSSAAGPSARSGAVGASGRTGAVERPFRLGTGVPQRPAGVSEGAPGGDGQPSVRPAPESRRLADVQRDPHAETPGPPPPAATARFPDAPPAVGAAPAADAPGIVETTARLRPVQPARPFVTLAQPDTRGVEPPGPRLHLGARVRPRVAASAACLVLGLGLIGGAVTGSWLTGDDSPDGARGAYAVAGTLWHSVPVDRLFPPTVNGPGAGPGGADRTWTRIAVAPDGGCADAFDPLLRKALAPVGCLRLLRATYTDATRSQVTTVGLLFTRADAAAMGALASRFKDEGLDRRTDLMPRPYAAEGTVAAGFGDAQRASWTISVLTDAPVVVYAVSGFADGRTVTEPEPAENAMKTGATTAPAQAGLGNDAAGLADRVEAALRKTFTSATEKPS